MCTATETPLQLEQFSSRGAWLRSRSTFIGASESPAIFGQGYAGHGKATVYADKVVPVDTANVSDGMLLGIHCEPGVIAAANEKLGLSIQHSGYAVCRSREYDFIGFTPDGILDGGECTVEVKNLGSYGSRRLLEDEQHLPLLYEIQLQHQMYCSGHDRILFVANMGNDLIYHQFVPRRQDLIDILVPTLVTFWTEYVVKRVVPPDDDPVSLRQAMARLFPKEDPGKAIQLASDDEQLLELRDKLLEEKKSVEEQIKSIDAKLISKLEDAAFGQFPSGRVASWRTVRRNEYCVKESTSRQFRILNKLPKGVQIDE